MYCRYDTDTVDCSSIEAALKKVISSDSKIDATVFHLRK